MSKQVGLVRSVIEKEERRFVYIVIVYIRVLAGIGSLWAGEVLLRLSRYVDPTAVRIAVPLRCRCSCRFDAQVTGLDASSCLAAVFTTL